MPMRYKRKVEIFISEDLIDKPKELRFSANDDEVDIVTLTKCKTISDTFATGTHVIDMEQITAGKYLYIVADKVVTVTTNGPEIITFGTLNKSSEMWINFTTITIDTTSATRLTLVLAGT